MLSRCSSHPLLFFALAFVRSFAIANLCKFAPEASPRSFERPLAPPGSQEMLGKSNCPANIFHAPGGQNARVWICAGTAYHGWRRREDIQASSPTSAVRRSPIPFVCVYMFDASSGRKCIVQLGDNAAYVGPSIGNEIWNILLS